MGQPEIILVLGSAFGLFIFFYLLTAYRRQKQIQRHGETTDGKVVHLVPIYDPEYPDSSEHVRYEPIIRFQMRNGAIITAHYTRTTFFKWHVGQQLTVRYLPANPHQFFLPIHWDSTEDWLFTGMMLGAAAVVISILAYFSQTE